MTGLLQAADDLVGLDPARDQGDRVLRKGAQRARPIEPDALDQRRARQREAGVEKAAVAARGAEADALRLDQRDRPAALGQAEGRVGTGQAAADDAGVDCQVPVQRRAAPTVVARARVVGIGVVGLCHGHSARAPILPGDHDLGSVW